MFTSFFKRVMAHTISARQRWGFMEAKKVQKSLWNQVLVEEVGKLSRACNKLTLATDEGVRTQWTEEAKFRLVTIASISGRFYEAFESLADAPEQYASGLVDK